MCPIEYLIDANGVACLSSVALIGLNTKFIMLKEVECGEDILNVSNLHLFKVICFLYLGLLSNNWKLLILFMIL